MEGQVLTEIVYSAFFFKEIVFYDLMSLSDHSRGVFFIGHLPPQHFRQDEV